MICDRALLGFRFTRVSFSLFIFFWLVRALLATRVYDEGGRVRRGQHLAVAGCVGARLRPSQVSPPSHEFAAASNAAIFMSNPAAPISFESRLYLVGVFRQSQLALRLSSVDSSHVGVDGRGRAINHRR